MSCGRVQDHMQVAAIRKLLSKLHPEVVRIFQQALPGIQKEEKPVWFSTMLLGHVVIGVMLPRISKAAQLSKRYTNHCVRATSIVLIKRQDLTTEQCVTSLATIMSKSWTATVAQASGRSAHCPQRSTARPQAIRRCRHQRAAENPAVNPKNSVKRALVKASPFKDILKQPKLHFLRRKPYSSMLRSTSVQMKQSPTGHAQPERC